MHFIPPRFAEAATLRFSTIAFIAIVALSLVGCRDEKTRVAQDPDSFVLNADLFNETEDETYIWMTTVTQAGVSFRARDFFTGIVFIEIFDGAGELVFEQEYRAEPNEEDVSSFGFTLPAGIPGNWTIVVDYVNFSGDLRLIIE